MATASDSRKYWHVARIIITSIAAVAFVIVTMMWLMGYFHPKLTATPTDAAGRPLGNARVGQVEKMRLPVAESAVGTVRPVHESAVASKIMAKVVAVNVRPEIVLSKGAVLVQAGDSGCRV
jgi:multidrug efflux pump subunit AcrA (membrane-fusion protein)